MITARASKQNVDVKRAKDYEVVFDASFPILRIAKRGSFSVPPAVQEIIEGGAIIHPQTIVEHSLGFYPMFIVFSKTDGKYGRNGSANLRISKTHLLWSENNASLSGHYILFDYDLDNPNKFDIVNTGSPKNESEKKRDDNIGLATKDENGRVLFSTEYMQPIIHMVGHGIYNKAPNYQEFEHGLGYAPQYWLYMKNINGDGNYQMTMGSASDFLYFSNETKVGFASLYNNLEYSFIIMKDPLGA